MNYHNDSSKNIIDVIDAALNKLNVEKTEMEQKYGISEDLLDEYLDEDEQGGKFEKELSKKNYKLKTKYASQLNNKNLPKLETKMKESKTFYKTPETLKDSLKYEPRLKDLLTEEEFEPNYRNLNSLKTAPRLDQGYDLKSYIDRLNKEIEDTHL